MYCIKCGFAENLPYGYPACSVLFHIELNVGSISISFDTELNSVDSGEKYLIAKLSTSPFPAPSAIFPIKADPSGTGSSVLKISTSKG